MPTYGITEPPEMYGFADLQVDILLQNHNLAWSYEIPGTAQLLNFQYTDSKFRLFNGRLLY